LISLTLCLVIGIFLTDITLTKQTHFNRRNNFDMRKDFKYFNLLSGKY